MSDLFLSSTFNLKGHAQKTKEEKKRDFLIVKKNYRGHLLPVYFILIKSLKHVLSSFKSFHLILQHLHPNIVIKISFFLLSLHERRKRIWLFSFPIFTWFSKFASISEYIVRKYDEWDFHNTFLTITPCNLLLMIKLI